MSPPVNSTSDEFPKGRGVIQQMTAPQKHSWCRRSRVTPFLLQKMEIEMVTRQCHSDDLPTYLTTKEVAQFLNLTSETVKRWLREGTIQGVKFGRQWRIPSTELTILKGEENYERSTFDSE